MAIIFPSYNEIISRILSDMEANLPEIDPTIDGTFENAFAVSLGGRAFDINKLLEQILKQFFPQTATGESLELHAGYDGLTRNPATSSAGKTTFTGTASSIVPINTQVKTSTGNIYTTDSAITLVSIVASVTSITRVGSIATVTTTADHKISSGMSIVIAGAVETDYNGTFPVTVTALDKFEYTVTGTPTTPATGTITATFTGEEVVVTSESTGIVQNLISGTQLDLISPISGVDSTSLVQYSAITGAKDLETDSDLFKRVLTKRANPVSNFNVAAIEEQCFKISGVTRVKVKRITPAKGSVTILFLRDDDPTIAPDSGEITTVKNEIIKIMPATTDTADIIVKAPTLVTTNYVFSSITPDTSTMRTAIDNELKAFYRDELAFETTITADTYKKVIANTIDTVTGDTLTAFTLTSPSADITITTDEIGAMGTTTFP